MAFNRNSINCPASTSDNYASSKWFGVPENFRAYGLLMRGNCVLIAEEIVGKIFCWKFPGGKVEEGEYAEQALIREFQEEASLPVDVIQLLYSPGTLVSPWIKKNYTPIYYLVHGKGQITVPSNEALKLSFREPEEILKSKIVADPEKEALTRLLQF